MSEDESTQPEQEPDADEQALKERIQELEDRLAAMQEELEQQEHRPSIWQNLRRNLRPLVILTVILVSALIPSILVVRERWLNLPAWSLFTIDSWCDNEFLCHTALPSYFGYIFLFSLVVVLFILFYKEQHAEPAEAQDREEASETETAEEEDEQPPSPGEGGDERRLSKSLVRTSLGLRWGAVALAAAFTILVPLTGTIHGWGFGLAILCYLAGWMLPVQQGMDFDWGSLWQSLLNNWKLILSVSLALISLILFLQALAWAPPFAWVTLILAVLAFANLARFYRQLPTIFWVFILALASYSVYINRWSFATIGDEYAFFNRALEIASRQRLGGILANLFNGTDVYGTHPYFSSVLQALSMKLFGIDSFGWRFSNALVSAAGVVLFYAFFTRFTRRTVALLIAVLLATSVYLMTFGKIGYNNLQAFLCMGLVLWAAGWALQSQRRLAYAAWGLSMGLCFYVYPAALYILPLPVLLVLMFAFPRSRQSLRLWGIAGVGLLIFLLPLLFQPEYWQSKGMGLITFNPEVTASTRNVALHLFANFVDSLYSFLYTPQESHLVPVAYADPLTAAFILVGLGLSFRRIPQQRFSVYTMISFVFLLIVAGVSHDRRFPPTTRMFLLLPWFAYFAAEAIAWLVEQVASLRLTRWTRNGMIAVTVIAIVLLNFYQAYALSLRRNNANQSTEALLLGIVQRLPEFEPVRAKPLTFLFLTDGQWGIDGLYTLFQAYKYPASRLRLAQEQLSEAMIPEAIKPLIQDRETLVILQPTMNAGWQAELSNQLLSLGRESCDIKEFTGVDTRFTLWHDPGLQELCAFP